MGSEDKYFEVTGPHSNSCVVKVSRNGGLTAMGIGDREVMSHIRYVGGRMICSKGYSAKDHRETRLSSSKGLEVLA